MVSKAANEGISMAGGDNTARSNYVKALKELQDLERDRIASDILAESASHSGAPQWEIDGYHKRAATAESKYDLKAQQIRQFYKPKDGFTAVEQDIEGYTYQGERAGEEIAEAEIEKRGWKTGTEIDAEIETHQRQEAARQEEAQKKAETTVEANERRSRFTVIEGGKDPTDDRRDRDRRDGDGTPPKSPKGGGGRPRRPGGKAGLEGIDVGDFLPSFVASIADIVDDVTIPIGLRAIFHTKPEHSR